MHAKSLKLLCRGTLSVSPRSVSVTDDSLESNIDAIRSRVSEGAKLISSSRTQSPARSAVMNSPSTNEKQKLFLALKSCCSRLDILVCKVSHCNCRECKRVFALAETPSTESVDVLFKIWSSAALDPGKKT